MNQAPVDSAGPPRRRPFLPALMAMTLLLLIAVAVGVSFGATSVSLFTGDAVTRQILYGIRLPRVLLAAAVGATLAIAGATFQTVLRNGLADPFILGVSGGAAASAAVATACGLGRFPGLVQAMAFAGACLATGAVFILARRREYTDPGRLLLSGLVLNAFFSAVILMAFSLASQGDLNAALRWMMGTLFGASWLQVIVLSVSVVVAMGILVYMSNDIRMLTFGEEDAKSRGVNVERVKLVAFIATSFVTGVAVSVSGIIGFVGLLVPHLIRMIWRRDFRFLLPLSALGGATILVLADLLSRMLLRPLELPVGVFTALLGVPFFLILLRKDG